MALTEKLSAIGDAIREKTGKEDKLSLDQMPLEIASITGGGGGGDALLASIFDMTCTEFASEAVTQIKIARSFESNTALKKVSLPEIQVIIGGFIFTKCTSLKEVHMPKLRVCSGMSVFDSCPSLEEIVFPQVVQMNGQAMFRSSGLKRIILPCKERLDVDGIIFNQNFGQNAFVSCASLKTLVLGAEDKIWGLTNINAFNGTPFASGGAGGTVYVPSALIESYRTATNWSTLYAAGTCNFVAIEGSEYE